MISVATPTRRRTRPGLPVPHGLSSATPVCRIPAVRAQLMAAPAAPPGVADPAYRQSGTLAPVRLGRRIPQPGADRCAHSPGQAHRGIGAARWHDSRGRLCRSLGRSPASQLQPPSSQAPATWCSDSWLHGLRISCSNRNPVRLHSARPGTAQQKRQLMASRVTMENQPGRYPHSTNELAEVLPSSHPPLVPGVTLTGDEHQQRVPRVLYVVVCAAPAQWR
jgi:hypothetical protein